MLHKIYFHFPYELTHDQKRTVQEIAQDMKSGAPMIRMLQGDVGCGKTTVAFISALIANLNGHQAALMCPTEVLALQHYHASLALFRAFNFNCQLLLGSFSHKQKERALTNISSGKCHFIIGTHSLLQSQVLFHSLALTIIDEQHKFGVSQRLKLSSKSYQGHLLSMSATPIPRSLQLTHFGEQDLSVIKSFPRHKKKVKTRIITAPLFAQFLSFVATRINMGEQAYIVSPAIEDHPDYSFVAAKKTLNRFTNFFPQIPIGILHGKLTTNEKKSALEHFTEEKTKILISTSIVEVGIDIANASIMAIMDAERFGLSTLHQLRGRVGRGRKPGFCFLLTENATQKALQRLKIVEQTTDGFAIAEADLEIRGEGNIFGSHQSGKNPRKIANIITDQEILYQVKEDYQKSMNLI